MICDSCKYAGKQNKLYIESGNEALVRLIQAAHAQCKDGSESRPFGGAWCDCQHVVGQALNRVLLKPAGLCTRYLLSRAVTCAGAR